MLIRLTADNASVFMPKYSEGFNACLILVMEDAPHFIRKAKFNNPCIIDLTCGMLDDICL